MIKSTRLLANLIKSNRALSVNLIERHASQKSESNDALVNPNYENRNPRNLEWSGQQYKRFGWNLQYPPKDFYHRCVFVKNANGLEAYLEHHSNGILFKISTSDLSLRQHLFSGQDMSSAINIAKVFAERCKRSGITTLNYLKGVSFETSTKEKAFYNTLIECGLTLQEPEFIEKTNEIPGLDYDKKDFYHERLEARPFPPIINKIKRQALEKALKEKQSNLS